MAKRIEVVLALLIAIACGAASASTTPVITVNYPVNGSTVKGPVYYAASASTSCAKGIAAMRIYSAPNVPAYTVNAAQFSTFLKLSRKL